MILFIIVLFTIVFFSIWSALNNKKYRQIKNLDLKNIQIYLIHQKKKKHRLDRCRQFFDQYFRGCRIEIVEPVVVNPNKLSRLVKDNMLSPLSERDIIDQKTVFKGSLTISSLSLYLTNLGIYRKELKRKNYFLILEDDFIPETDFSRSIKTTLDDLPERWHLIYLQLHHDDMLWKDKTQNSNKILIQRIYHQTAAV